MNTLEAESKILPRFPNSYHIVYDLDNMGLFSSNIIIEDKIDGELCGTVLNLNNPMIRKRDVKYEFSEKHSNRSVIAWMKINKEKFLYMSKIGSYSIYGQWKIKGRNFSERFIAHDVYDYKNEFWLPPLEARMHLQVAGFSIPTLRFYGKFDDCFNFCNLKIKKFCIKVYDETKTTHRFKLINECKRKNCLFC